ncbi:MAG: hypothetical protein Q9186_005798 [Xanthomendoza sp. 1 TL-2023]
MDEHNRPDTKTSWSERHVGILHRYAIDRKTSIWIAVQASARIKQHLKHVFAAASGRQISLADHLSLHLLFFLELGSKWRAYIKYMEEQLADMDEKVLHSKVGVAQYVDYSVTFRDTQDLELIRRRLIKASLNLKSNADVGKSWEEETIKLTGHLATNELDQIFVTVRKYITDMYQHARIIDSLLERLDGTQNLLFEILRYRNHEVQIRTNTAIEANGTILRALTGQARAESGFITRLTADINNDSKFIKLLTFLTLMYTPASLVALQSCDDVVLEQAYYWVSGEPLAIE